MAQVEQNNLPLEYKTQDNQMVILGFWIFIGAEVALFATLFAVYMVLSGNVSTGPSGADLFQLRDALIETIILLTSSFTCGIAIHKLRQNNLKGLITWLSVTLVLGLAFLSIEIYEFVHYIHLGATLQTSAFTSSFFVLVGTHGAHVTFGIIWGSLLIMQLIKRGITAVTARKVFVLGLYWHFLDVVWVFVFTIVYLNGMVK